MTLGLSLGFANITSAETISDSTSKKNQEVNQRFTFLYGSYQPYQRFFKDLQIAIDQNHRIKVASMIHYPIFINLNNQKFKIRSAREFLNHYNEIFDPQLIQIIQKQSYGNLFANTKGIMVGEHGELWFTGICKDRACKKVSVKIIAINK